MATTAPESARVTRLAGPDSWRSCSSRAAVSRRWRMTSQASVVKVGVEARADHRPSVAATGASELAGRAALRQHWPEYLIEAGGLGFFMVSACVFATLLEYPGSPVRHAIVDAMLRRIPMGLAMGVTAMAIVYSRWGQRSGAHLNPAVSLTFWRLGKVEGWDALFYIAAQFVGAIVGVGIAATALGDA